jgi:hypothetical protein
MFTSSYNIDPLDEFDRNEVLTFLSDMLPSNSGSKSTEKIGALHLGQLEFCEE